MQEGFCRDLNPDNLDVFAYRENLDIFSFLFFFFFGHHSMLSAMC